MEKLDMDAFGKWHDEIATLLIDEALRNGSATRVGDGDDGDAEGDDDGGGNDDGAPGGVGGRTVLSAAAGKKSQRGTPPRRGSSEVREGVEVTLVSGGGRRRRRNRMGVGGAGAYGLSRGISRSLQFRRRSRSSAASGDGDGCATSQSDNNNDRTRPSPPRRAGKAATAPQSPGGQSSVSSALPSLPLFNGNDGSAAGTAENTTRQPIDYLHPRCVLQKEAPKQKSKMPFGNNGNARAGGNNKRSRGQDGKRKSKRGGEGGGAAATDPANGASAVGRHETLAKVQEKLSMLGEIESGKFGKAAEMLRSDAVAFVLRGGDEMRPRGEFEGYE